MDIKKQIEKLVPHLSRYCSTVKGKSCDCGAVKRRAQFLALFTQSVEEIIGDDLGYSESPTDKEYWDKANRNIEVMNALRAEQRARLATLIKQ